MYIRAHVHMCGVRSQRDQCQVMRSWYERSLQFALTM